MKVIACRVYKKKFIPTDTFSNLIPTLLAHMPNNPNILLIGSDKGEILVMDTRNLKERLSKTALHASNINRFVFNPSKYVSER